MQIPDYQSIMLPLLQFAGDGQEHRSRDGIAALAQHFNLTPEELGKLLPSGQDYVFSNRWGWARTYLKKAGLIQYPAWGRFKITDAGQSLLHKAPAKIDVSLLKQYPEFLEFWNGPSKQENGQATPTNAEPPPDETPEELVDSTIGKLRQQIQSELLSKVMSCSPAYFERLVVKLLTSMGYGGSMADAGSALGRTGDGGIDGEIKEDKLGLDRIYIQAKRWGNSNNVGPHEVRDFIGALAGKRARKGVLITTTQFSKDAISCAANLEKTVILIDGGRLTELMFEYGLGVTTKKTLYVKSIDNDFFDEEEV